MIGDRGLGGTVFHFYTCQTTGRLMCRVEDIGVPVMELEERYVRRGDLRRGRDLSFSASLFDDTYRIDPEPARPARHDFETFDAYGAKAPPLQVMRDVVVGAREIVAASVAASRRAHAEVGAQISRETADLRKQVDKLRGQLQAHRRRQKRRRGSR